MTRTVFVTYNTPEERKAAFLRSVNLRKEWEKRMREKMQELGIKIKEVVQ